MKIYLASFMEKKNHGAGDIISIENGRKPLIVDVEKQFKPFTPTIEMVNSYNSERKENPEKASTNFILKYNKQLKTECNKIKKAAARRGKTIQEFLPFKDGDTLASWPRSGFRSHRTLIVPYLEDLGYEVVAN